MLSGDREVYNSSHKSATGQASFGVILLLILSVLANLFACNHGCSMIQSSELESLIIIASNQTEPNNTTIRLIEYTFVCIAQGAEQDTWRFVSLVANYTNTNGTNSISQFQFECVESNWTATVNGSTEYTRTDPPDASLNTSLRRDCALCIDPQQAPLANNSHHCLACDESCSGLQRCTSSSQDSCCNYFLGDQCTASCPNYFLPSSNFTCVCPSGFTGILCESDINECNVSLCLNGVCENTLGSYTCNCNLGYTGDMCDVNINDCLEQPCLNGGLCLDTIDSFSCNCTDGWAGSVCDVCALEGCAECVARFNSTPDCDSCQDGYSSLTISSGQLKCEAVSETSGLSSGTIVGIVLAVVIGVVLVVTLVVLLMAALYIHKRKRVSSKFRKSNIRADQESSANVTRNPVFESDVAEGTDSGISIESDEHFAVNKAALEFEEESD